MKMSNFLIKYFHQAEHLYAIASKKYLSSKMWDGFEYKTYSKERSSFCIASRITWKEFLIKERLTMVTILQLPATHFPTATGVSREYLKTKKLMGFAFTT